MKKLELYLFVIFVTFLLPLFISLKTIDPGLFPRFILLALSAVIIEAIAIVRIVREGLSKNHTVGISSLHYFLGGYLLFTALSLLKAVNSAESIFEILRVALFVIGTIIAFRIINRSEKDRIVVIKTIIMTSLLVALLGIMEYWGVFQLTDCGEFAFPSSTMGNRNLLSSYLFLCSGFVLFGLFRFTGTWYYINIFTCSAIMYVLCSGYARAVETDKSFELRLWAVSR